MRVALLPTGRTEWHGMAAALERLFPGHEFYCLPEQAEVVSNPERFPLRGFTSARLSATHEQQPPEDASELLQRAAQEALGDRRRSAADLVAILDDVELANRDQPERVVAVMRRAAQSHLDGLREHRALERTEEALRQKVSFHLIAPMIEAWFFADDAALSRAGVEQPGAAQIDGDPERFTTSDPDFLEATEQDCPTWSSLARGRKRKLRPKWLGGAERRHHPKGYLQWLAIAPHERTCMRYSETDLGGPALAELSWAGLLGTAEHCALAKALVEDIAEGLGVTPAVEVVGDAADLTARHRAPQDALLRNL